MGITHIFVKEIKKIQKIVKIVKIVAFGGNSWSICGDGGGEGMLNSNHRGTVQGKMPGDPGELVPLVPRSIPIFD